MRIDDNVAALQMPRAPEVIGPGDFTKHHAAELAELHGWTPISAAEVPHYQRKDATHGRLTRFLRVLDPGVNGVLEYITLHWDDEGRWTGLASCDRHQRGVNICTDWMRTSTCVAKCFRGGMTEDYTRDAAQRPRGRSRAEARLHALPS